MRAGKHVLAEKPLTTDPRQTRELIGRARAGGLVLMENYMFVRHSRHARVRELVAAGAIGELRTLYGTFTMPPRPAGDIRHDPGLGGGALLDNGGYPIRAAQLFLGPDLEVAGACLHVDPALKVDVSGSALLRGPGGVTAHLLFGMAHLYVSDYQLLGSTGRITVERAFTPPASHPPTIRLDRQDERQYLTGVPDDQVAKALTAFVTAVRDGAAPAGEAGVTVRQAELVEEIRRKALRCPA